MKRRDRRARATGRLGVQRGERYALIPAELLESEAWGTLSGTASRVLVVLAVQYTGANNGRLSLPYSVARGFGIRRKGALSAGLAELERRGIIEITRHGGLPPLATGCNWYALGWRALDGDDARGLKPRPAENRWATWQADDAERAKRRKAPTAEQRWPQRNQKPCPVNGPSRSGQRTTEADYRSGQRTTEADFQVRSTGTSKNSGVGATRGDREKSAHRGSSGRARPAHDAAASLPA